MIIRAAAVFTAFLIFLPENALAWGFQTHIAMGTKILADTDMLVLRSYPVHFLLGNIFPDFFNFLKDFSSVKRSMETHSWRTVSRLFKGAETDAEKAFAHGYAAHLSADIIAHNSFVPQHMLYMGKGRMSSHLLLEYAEEALHNNKYRGRLLSLIDDAHINGELFLRVMGVDRDYFYREAMSIRRAVYYQKMFRLQDMVKAYKMMSMPSFKEHCTIFRREAERFVKASVENGYHELKEHDPTGKGAMDEARKKRDDLLRTTTPSQLKDTLRRGNASEYNPA
ncbi:zinc dependent phospholipase C family protein [Limisalsivibrio acetivorans]|uniref:zinc dependent phospholipase C family protein n=1 Tax=Limisalsivibrio acetivorans TaxID=1304888 RepID=UPI0003B2ED2F|nr:zinc dependent phospholipase C family protein [Limisalsivibrio acetivorans]